MKTKWAQAVDPPPPHNYRELTPAVKTLQQSVYYYQWQKRNGICSAEACGNTQAHQVNAAFIFQAESWPPTRPEGSLPSIMQVINTKYPNDDQSIHMIRRNHEYIYSISKSIII